MRLSIDAPTFGPAGVGRREDGKVVMVHGAYPGDVVQVRLVAEHSGYSEADIETLERPSAERVPAPCPRQPECGGCAWMGLNLGAQRRYKRELVLRCVRNLRGAEELLGEVQYAGPELGYRQRARLAIEAQESVGGVWGMRLGFFKHGTHQVVPLQQCDVCMPELNRALGGLDGWPISSGMEGSVEMTRDASGEVMAAFYLGKPYRECQELAAGLVGGGVLAGCVVKAPGSTSGKSGKMLGHLVVAEEPEIQVPVTPVAFSQANPWVNRLLVRRTLEAVGVAGSGSAAGGRDPLQLVELYAGHGNFTRPLLAAGYRITAVELGVDLGLIEANPNLWFIQSDAAAAMKRLVRRKETRPATLLLDPPRTGAKEVMPLVVQMAPNKVVYISCDPNTFARDAAILQTGGYRLSSLQAFDMMPHTWHTELLAVLER